MPKIDQLPVDELDPKLIELIEAAPLPGLGDGPRCDGTAAKLRKHVGSNAWKGSLIEAGLWLLAGDLAQSHDISQSQDSAEGAFWHGIMHRREGDYGNSKYWFRRVGKHAVHRELAACIQAKLNDFSSDLPTAALVDSDTLPNGLVDACQDALTQHPDRVNDIRLICWWEWQLLFAATLTAVAQSE